MKTKLTRVTPALAREWLKHNTKNRHIRLTHVSFLAGEIKSGRWKTTHQGISRAEDNTLIDGQHRLLAIIEADTPVDMYVTTDAPAETRDVCDMGIVARDVGDMLHMMQGTTHAMQKVGACRHIIKFTCKYHSLKSSLPIIRGILEHFEAEMDYCIECMRGFRPALKSWVISALAFALKGDKRLADVIKRFGTGEGLKHGDPAKTMRDWLVNSTMSVKHQKTNAIEGIFNCLYHAASENNLIAIKPGLQGLNYFLGKNKAFVEGIRDKMQPQVEVRLNENRERRRARKIIGKDNGATT